MPTCGLIGGLSRRRAPAARRSIGWSAKTRLCGHISDGLPDIVKEGPRLRGVPHPKARRSDVKGAQTRDETREQADGRTPSQRA